MGAPGGLYRPTPRGYTCNPAGHWSQPSVSTLTGFSAHSFLRLLVSLQSPGRLLQSPSRVLKSLGRVRLQQSPGQSSKSPWRLRDILSRIRLFLA